MDHTNWTGSVNSFWRKQLNTAIAAMMLCIIFVCPVPHLVAQEFGTVRGIVEVPPYSKPASIQIPSRYGSIPASAAENETKKERPPEVTNVVLYLEGKGLESMRHDLPRPVLDQRNTMFIPHVLPIVRGTTVEIVNRDKTYHNVFSLSSTKKFDIGRRPTGEEVPVTFDKTGIVQVFCDIHSHMSAYIVVLENPLYVQPNADGTYAINGIPPGTYSLKAWHERFSAPSQSVTITPGSTVTVNFRLR
jgi:plastocyanin